MSPSRIELPAAYEPDVLARLRAELLHDPADVARYHGHAAGFLRIDLTAMKSFTARTQASSIQVSWT